MGFYRENLFMKTNSCMPSSLWIFLKILYSFIKYSWKHAFFYPFHQTIGNLDYNFSIWIKSEMRSLLSVAINIIQASGIFRALHAFVSRPFCPNAKSWLKYYYKERDCIAVLFFNQKLELILFKNVLSYIFVTNANSND